MNQLYREVYRESTQPDGEKGAIARARKKLMLQPRWPLCTLHTAPYTLGATLLATREYSVFLACDACMSYTYNHNGDLLG